jgi:competence protein ComFC
MKSNPIKINGNWNDGYALDKHSISSYPVGINEHGHTEFYTTRTELGDSIYKLKYNKLNTDEKINSVLNDITDTATAFILQNWGIKIDAIIPMPPSVPRSTQPVFLIARELGKKLNIPVFYNVVERLNSNQIKNLSQVEKGLLTYASFVKKNHNFSEPVNILLIDDLYSSGTSANLVSKILKTDSNINNIYFLSISKTKNGN